MRVIFTRTAQADIAEAYAWYEEREFGLGEEFLRCVEACTNRLHRHPLMYPVAVDKFRRAPLRRFPFEIFYEQNDEKLTIYAVFNCSQDPRKWRERLKSRE